MDQHAGHKLSAAAWAAGLFVLTPLFFGASEVFLRNTGEFSLVYSRLAGCAAPLSLALAAALAGMVWRLPRAWSVRATALLTALGAALWVQGNLLVWGYGVMDGREIRWADKTLNGLLDTSVWALLAGLAIWKSAWVTRRAGKIAAALLAIQVASLSILLAGKGPDPSHKLLMIGQEQKFAFSKQRNVIVLVLDGFQSNMFQEILDEDPSVAEPFTGFTYFRNTAGGFPTTFGSVPFLLTGRQYENRQPMRDFVREAFRSESSILKATKASGYHVFANPSPAIHVDEQIASDLQPRPMDPVAVAEVCDAALFRYLPHFMKRHVHNDYQWRLKKLGTWLQRGRLQRQQGIAKRPSRPADIPPAAWAWCPDIRFIAEMRSAIRGDMPQPTMKYYHLQGGHAPFRITEDLQYEQMPFDVPSYKRQLKGNLRLAAQFLSILRENGLYEQSLIVVAADHGIGFPVRPPRQRLGGGWSIECNEWSSVPSDLPGGGLPLLLIKPLKADGPLRVSDAPVSLSDLPRTIAEQVGVQGDFPGRSAFSVAESEHRQRRYMRHRWEHDFWDRQRLPAMREYVIEGHSWSPAAWRSTGTEFAAEVRHLGPGPYRYGGAIRFGEGGDAEAYQGIGWSGPEKRFTWTSGPKANLLIPIDPARHDVRLSATFAMCLRGGQLSGQRVIVSVNGQRIAQWQVDAPGQYNCIIARSLLPGPELRISLELPDATSPSALGINADARTLAVAFKELLLEEVDPSSDTPGGESPEAAARAFMDAGSPGLPIPDGSGSQAGEVQAR